MVNNTLFDILLHHPYQFSKEENEQLEQLKLKYPYFQAIKAMQLKYLKEQKLSSNNLLTEAAAHSIDRKVLFMYIEDNKLLFRSKDKTNIKSKKNNEAKHLTTQNYKLINKQKDEIINDLTTTKKLPTRQSEKSIEKIVEISQKKEVEGLTDTTRIDSANSQKKNFDYQAKKHRKTTIENKQNISPKRNIDQKMSYIDWLEQVNQSKTEKKSNIFDAIDKFLKNKPKIVPVKNKNLKAPAIIEESVTEKQMLMTETLANLYVKQKKYDKAIQAFKILSLKYPKKSSYFANRISEIKQN